MTKDFVLYEKEGNIVRITLNRPEKLNCYSIEDFPQIQAAFERVNEDEEVKVAILKGAGRAFSSGYDMAKLGAQYFETDHRPSQRHRLRIEKQINNMYSSIPLCDKITIAQAHGYVLGGALQLFLGCDILICAEGTKLGAPDARMMGPAACSVTLSLIKLGPALTSDLVMIGDHVSAEELYRRGVINKLVPLEKLEEEVEATAKKICQMPADGLVIGKKYFQIAWDLLGANLTLSTGLFAHGVGVQQRLEPGEWNLFKERQALGAKAAWHGRDDRFAKPA